MYLVPLGPYRSECQHPHYEIMENEYGYFECWRCLTCNVYFKRELPEQNKSWRARLKCWMGGHHSTGPSWGIGFVAARDKIKIVHCDNCHKLFMQSWFE